MLLKIGEVAGKILLSFIIFLVLFQLPIELLPDQDLLLGIWQNIVFVITVLIMYALFEKNRGWSLGLKQNQPVLHFFKGAGLGIVLMTLSFGLIFLFGGFKIEGINDSKMFWISATSSLILFIMVGIGEEIYSRGYIQGLLTYRFSNGVSWITSSALFALLHFSNPGMWDEPLPVINLFLAGVVFAIYRDVSGGIWAPIGLHFTWNFFQGPIFGFHVSGLDNNSLIQITPQGPAFISGGSFGAEGSFLDIIVLIGAILWYWGRFRKMKVKASV